MSALPPKADIAQYGGNVRFVPKADSCSEAKKHASASILLQLVSPLMWVFKFQV